MGPAKVQAILDWPAPRSARAVRGFLSLAGYYLKFVHNYGTVAAPLTALKKDGFTWDDAAAAAFTALKAAVTTAPALAMPDFSKLFVVECDASSHGFGAVLVQDDHLVAFFSRPIALRHHSSTLTSGNSSASSRRFGIGGRIYGGGASLSRPTTTTSNTSSTSPGHNTPTPLGRQHLGV
jgi:hypothetical protein